MPPVLWASSRRAGMSFVEDFLAGFVATSRRDTPHAQTSPVLCCMGSSPDQSLCGGASGPLVLNELGRGAWVRVTLSSRGSHSASSPVRRPLWFPVQPPTDCLLLGRHLAAMFCTAGLCWSHQLGRLWGRMTLKWREAREGEQWEQQKPGRFLASRCLASSGSFCAGCCLDENGRTVAGALCTQVWPLGKHCLAPCESAAVVAFLSLCSRFITLAELVVKCLDCFLLLPSPLSFFFICGDGHYPFEMSTMNDAAQSSSNL